MRIATRAGAFGIIAVLFSVVLVGQTRIDSSFAFQTDPAKRFGLYIPSSYVEGVPNKAVLALHPFHQAWGNSTTWCDILTDFAEANNLVMACPDGGQDGRIDDAIDKAFFTALLDSVSNWYTINPDKVFILGFSWGARAAYTYGLANHENFAGFITIGAFVNGTNEVTPTLLANSDNEPFYIMHGDQDNVANINTAFFPIRDALIDNGAIVNSLILEGVGHTINFPNRDQILTTAFNWVDSVDSDIAVGIEDAPSTIPSLHKLEQNYPNPFNPTTTITYSIGKPGPVSIKLYDITGREIQTLVNEVQPANTYSINFDANELSSGIYFYRLQVDRNFVDMKKMVLLR